MHLLCMQYVCTISHKHGQLIRIEWKHACMHNINVWGYTEIFPHDLACQQNKMK